MQKFFFLILTCCFPVLWLTNSAMAAAGDLDPSFGSGGLVTTDLLNTLEVIRKVAVQTDGKLVAVGNSGSNDVLVRYKLNGSLDPTFGSGGKVIGLRGVRPATVVIQPNGKIIAGGAAAGGDFGLVRFNKDGSIDASFGNAGLATTDFFGTPDQVWDLVLQPDGKIVAVGDADSANWLALARFNSDGNLDTSFGDSGRLTPGVAPGIEQGLAIAIQPDLSIVAAGQAYNGAVTRGDFAIVRLDRNGQLDESFGNDGRVLTDFDNGYDGANAITIQPDGKILAAGMGADKFGLARYNTDGSLDNTFGNGGKVVTTFFGRTDTATALALQPDGKIVVSGSATFSGGDGTSGAIRRFALARYNVVDGSLDASFGDQGKVTTDFSGDSMATCLTLQPDGKLVVSGSANLVDFALARYLTTPTNSPVLQTEANSTQAVALDSVTFVRDPFSVTTEQNFSADHQTRIILLATNLTISSGENFSSVSVKAEAAGGAIQTLPVEYVGPVPGSEWLTQVVVRLPAQLANAGTMQVSITHGNTSNQGSIVIK
ncbi:MAG TPA: hypothetical protein VE977_13580 [Pyrinomonadaceae bacterium]|nr:hypothetical protein [Pyrinomonadaceae bacterium]